MANPYEGVAVRVIAVNPYEGIAVPVPAGAAPPSVSVAEDVAKAAGSGVVKGVVGVATTPRTVIDLAGSAARWAGSKLFGEEAINTAAPYAQKAWNIAARASPILSSSLGPTNAEVTQKVEEVTGPLYKPQTTAGEFAHTIGEFAPGAAMMPGSAAARIGLGVVAPAIGSETAGQVTKGSQLEPLARVAGAVAGSALPAMAARAYVPVGTNPERARMVGELRREGVTDISAGQATGSKPLRWLESVSADTPGAGGRAAQMAESAGEQYTRAALRRAGIDANRATPEVIDQGFARIGQQFDDLASKTVAQITPVDMRYMQMHVRNFESVTPPSMQPPIVRELVNDIATHAGNPMLGTVYSHYRSLIETAARNASDPSVSRALREIRNVLDNAIERSMPADMQGQWQQARRHYRNILVLEKAAQAAGENAALGLISPSALRNATRSVHGDRAYARGQGDFAMLARAGESILRPLPQSGTGPRTAALGVGQAIGAGAGAMLGGAPGAALGALGAPIGQAVLAQMMLSRPMQRYLGASGRARPAPPGLGPMSSTYVGANAQQQ